MKLFQKLGHDLNDSQRHVNSVNSLVSFNIEISSTNESSGTFYGARSTNSEQSVFISDSSNNGSTESEVSDDPNNDTYSQNKKKHWTNNGLKDVFIILSSF